MSMIASLCVLTEKNFSATVFFRDFPGSASSARIQQNWTTYHNPALPRKLTGQSVLIR